MTLPGSPLPSSIRSRTTASAGLDCECRYADEFASHSLLQEFYFGSDPAAPPRLSCRRRGGFAAIQIVYDIVEADGIKLPSKRRAYRCDASGRPLADELDGVHRWMRIHLTCFSSEVSTDQPWTRGPRSSAAEAKPCGGGAMRTVRKPDALCGRHWKRSTLMSETGSYEFR